MPVKKEVDMKMIMVVLMVRFIVRMFEKEKNKNSVSDKANKIIHPAEFEIR